MRRTLFISTGLLLGVFVLFGMQREAEAPRTSTTAGAVSRNASRDVSTLFVGTIAISIELALTNDERTLGLGGREALPPDSGMLFVFPRADIHGIWMKDMRFPIDIIWLAPAQRDAECAQSGKEDALCLIVVGLKEHAAPESYPESFYPKEKALYVLELNAGFARENGIQSGAVVALKLP